MSARIPALLATLGGVLATGGCSDPTAVADTTPQQLEAQNPTAQRVRVDEVRSGQLGGLDGIEISTMNISGMLAPTATDCNDAGELIAHIGDLGVTSNLTVFGIELDLEIWASFTAGIVLAADDTGISISLTDIKSLDSEVTVLQDDMVAFEPVIADLIEDQLIGTLMDSLGGEALGSFPLPEIDLSEEVGLPPGTAVIAISPQTLERVDGNTIVGGVLSQ